MPRPLPSRERRFLESETRRAPVTGERYVSHRPIEVDDDLVLRAYHGVYGDDREPDKELFEHARAILKAALT